MLGCCRYSNYFVRARRFPRYWSKSGGRLTRNLLHVVGLESLDAGEQWQHPAVGNGDMFVELEMKSRHEINACCLLEKERSTTS